MVFSFRKGLKLGYRVGAGIAMLDVRCWILYLRS